MKKITSIDEANRYLKEVYLPKHNKQFTIPPKEGQSMYMPYIGIDIENILCVQEERVVQNDNTVKYGGKLLHVPSSGSRYHCVKCKVMVHEYGNGNIKLFYGRMMIGSYDRNGNLIKKVEKKMAV